jgi:uncharacterized flavoprotein (TIGR03862 family)
MIDVCVIGAGPAGLMAAEVAVDNGLSVTIIDAKPSFGRKFLMAGKSGLNLTKDEPFEDFISVFGQSKNWLNPMLSDFGNADVIDWANILGQDVFTGSSGRVFPKSMKASPLLRAWLLRLANKGVQFKTRWRWLGWNQAELMFQTPDGDQNLKTRATVLALGGASWPNLGSDGVWADMLTKEGIITAPFKPANMGFSINWSNYMKSFFGAPIKTVNLTAGDITVRGDFIISSKGIEGSAIYAVSQIIRDGAELTVDLLPDSAIEALQERINRLPKKPSRSTVLRKALRFNSAKAALFNEFARDTTVTEFARVAKSLPIKHAGPRPIAEAISTAGGVPQSELDEHLMLHKKPSVFCAGEMLDWEAPTGGYLITGCLATGKRAGKGVAAYLRK